VMIDFAHWPGLNHIDEIGDPRAAAREEEAVAARERMVANGKSCIDTGAWLKTLSLFPSCPAPIVTLCSSKPRDLKVHLPEPTWSPRAKVEAALPVAPSEKTDKHDATFFEKAEQHDPASLAETEKADSMV
jgi:hypothetical protein